jgi:hypothetical protein
VHTTHRRRDARADPPVLRQTARTKAAVRLACATRGWWLVLTVISARYNIFIVSG